MTELEQFAALRTWLIGETGLATIIRANPNAPRPGRPYGVLNLIRSERVNWPDDIEYEPRDLDTGEDGEPADEVPVETWEFTWSLSVYGEHAEGYARRTTSASKSGSALARLAPLTLRRTSGIRRIPELLNETTWEDRAQIDLFVHGLVRHGFAADLIESGTADIGPAATGAEP